VCGAIPMFVKYVGYKLCMYVFGLARVVLMEERGGKELTAWNLDLCRCLADPS
jgi:hypothetical protein